MARPLPLGDEPTTAGGQAGPTDPLLTPPSASEPTAPLDPAGLVGTMLGEYQVQGVVAVGGMGAVYRGIQPVIGKPVAIKVLLPEIGNDAEHAHRLLTEARAVNAIRHPHIVSIFSFGQTPSGQPFFVMELLNGESLLRWQRHHGRASVAETLSVLEQVLGALEAAHAAGVVHRDLKPGNLFMTPLGERFHVTVLDFGTAKGLKAPIAQFATKPGLVLGTLGYMAPEQMRGLDIGPAIDIYAMGVVAFWLLTGTDVFSRESDLELTKDHLWSEVPTLASRGVEAPAALEALVASMLAKEAAARPTAGDALRAVQRIAQELPVPGGAVASAAPPAAEESARLWPLLLTCVALAAVGAGVFTALSDNEAPQPLPDTRAHPIEAPSPARDEHLRELEVTPPPSPVAPARPKVSPLAATPPRAPVVRRAAATPTRETVGVYLRELEARSASLPDVERRAAARLLNNLSVQLAAGASPATVLEQAKSFETQIRFEAAP